MERQRVFNETLQSPPPGFEFGAGLSTTSRLGAVSDILRARPVPGLLQQQASFTDTDLFIDISRGTIVPKGCRTTTFCVGCNPPNRSFLDFEATPKCGGCEPSFHAFDDAMDCGDPTASIDGYASLKIDLSVFPFVGNQVTLVSLFVYSYQARVPISASPTGNMNVLVWGPGGVATDWLNGQGSLFVASVLPSGNETLTPHSFSPNVDLSGLSAFYVEAALHTVEAFPDNQDAFIGPQTLRLRATELLDVIVLAQGDGPISGAAVRILDSKGVIVATATTDSFGVASFALAPDNYFAESLLGSLSQTSSLLNPVSQNTTFTWPVPKPKVSYTQVALSAGQPNTFLDASGSSDPVNDTFAWDFGDGTSETGVGLIRVQHFYGAGIFSLKLTETGLDGLSGTVTLAVQGPRLA